MESAHNHPSPHLPLRIIQYTGILDSICMKVRTSDSNFLNSSSLAFLYSSISFFASSRASLTRFVRSIRSVSKRSISFVDPYHIGVVGGIVLTFSSYPKVSLISHSPSLNGYLTSLNNLLRLSLCLFPNSQPRPIPKTPISSSKVNECKYVRQAGSGFPPNSVRTTPPKHSVIDLSNTLKVRTILESSSAVILSISRWKGRYLDR